MVRTQIYLTESEQKGLRMLSRELGKKQSELIREAVDAFLAGFSRQNRLSQLQECRGIWKDRSDDDFREIRREISRRPER